MKKSANEISGHAADSALKQDSTPYNHLRQSGLDTVDLDGQTILDDEIATGKRRQSNAEIARDEAALEQLLSNSISNDASEETADSMVAG